MKTTKSVGLGIIGCGIAASELHWPALERLREAFDVVMVCNHTPQKARRLAETIGRTYGRDVPYVLDYRDLLASEDVRAVSVILPVELNREVCTAAAAAGKHVLVEKPIAENEVSARALLRLEEQYPHLVMMVAENYRYRAVFEELAGVLRSGAIGVPYLAEWRVWRHVDPATNPYARTSWRIQHRYEGGFVTDGGVHNVAALRDLLGDLTTVGSVSMSINPAIGRTDTLAWLFRSEGRSGVPPMSGSLSIGFSVSGAEVDRLTILGSRGAAVVDGSTLRLFGADSETPTGSHPPEEDAGYSGEYRDFHRCILTGERPTSTFGEAYKDLATILEALDGAAAV
jgi:predicted dehydrogenase